LSHGETKVKQRLLAYSISKCRVISCESEKTKLMNQN